MSDDQILSKAERDELVRVRNENGRLLKRVKEAEGKLERATRAKANTDRALAETQRKLKDAEARTVELGAPLVARETGEVFLVLRKAAPVGKATHPLGTPVARLTLLNGASMPFVADGYRTGLLAVREPTAVQGPEAAAPVETGGAKGQDDKAAS